MELFLACIAIAYFLTNAKVSGEAYKAGHEPPGVAKARMRHQAGGGAKTAAGKPSGPGAFRLMAASRWARACEASKDRGDRKAARRRAWLDEVTPQRDERWMRRKQSRLDRADAIRERWAQRRGLGDRVRDHRERHAEEEAWRENERRTAAETGQPDAEEEKRESAVTDDGYRPRPLPPDPSEEESAPRPASPVEPNTDGPPSSVRPASASGEESTSTTPATPEGTGDATVWQQVVDMCIDRADGVAAYRKNLSIFAQALADVGWGVEVHGPITDIDTHLISAEGYYRDLATTITDAGTRGAAAYDEAPWVPGPEAVMI